MTLLLPVEFHLKFPKNYAGDPVLILAATREGKKNIIKKIKIKKEGAQDGERWRKETNKRGIKE